MRMRGVFCGLTAAVSMLFVAASAHAAINARGSAEQVYATGLQPKASVALLDARGRTVRKQRVGELGGVIFRNVKPGDGYRVRVLPNGETSESLRVLTTSPTPPSTDIYNQTIQPRGYQYLTTRDGTKLAIYVHPPEDVAKALPTGIAPPPVPAGPTPTLIEYSGYGYANPAGPESGISVVGNLMGFTVVDVNMRGTGCSGGAFDFFETLQNLDGYDVIETIARQPWAKFGKVGMMGISYGGISQLFTAQTQPPSLAAITPLSVIDEVHTTLYPGGILNTGFAYEWAKERFNAAKPATENGGQKWAYKRIQEGDETCKENQALHAEAPDLLNKVKANRNYRPKVADPLSPVKFVDKIKVPTFLACQWTDEQTGGHCPTLASRLTGTDKKWVTFANGTHVDALAPETANRWYDFLKLYVAREPPMKDSAAMRAGAPVLYEAAMGVSGVTLPPDPVQEEPTYEGALARFEQFEPVRILFDNGAGSQPGYPVPGFEKSFPSWPAPGTTGRTWWFGRGGSMNDGRTRKAGEDSFRWNSKSRPLDNLRGGSGAEEGGIWTDKPDYDWRQPPGRNGVAYITKPLTSNIVALGAGFVDAWVRTSVPNVDLQVTVTEVRPDGKEVFVQNGWLRARMRKLDRKKSTPLAPRLSLLKRDERPLPRGRFTKLTIPLYYQGHAYRQGSRIRVTITAPNGDQPIWAFSRSSPAKGNPKVLIGYGGARRSRLVLPLVPGVEVPTPLPPCPGLRGEPCRDYKPLPNETSGQG